jgi:hypothetical protein
MTRVLQHSQRSFTARWYVGILRRVLRAMRCVPDDVVVIDVRQSSEHAAALACACALFPNSPATPAVAIRVAYNLASRTDDVRACSGRPCTQSHTLSPHVRSVTRSLAFVDVVPRPHSVTAQMLHESVSVFGTEAWDSVSAAMSLPSAYRITFPLTEPPPLPVDVLKAVARISRSRVLFRHATVTLKVGGCPYRRHCVLQCCCCPAPHSHPRILLLVVVERPALCPSLRHRVRSCFNSSVCVACAEPLPHRDPR